MGVNAVRIDQGLRREILSKGGLQVYYIVEGAIGLKGHLHEPLHTGLMLTVKF